LHVISRIRANGDCKTCEKASLKSPCGLPRVHSHSIRSVAVVATLREPCRESGGRGAPGRDPGLFSRLPLTRGAGPAAAGAADHKNGAPPPL